ncbi:MAG: flagellar hook assembly protein FlgD [Ideonella sp.]|nr:flagellar hook assembly protein FlgD [Ideonella sp.]
MSNSVSLETTGSSSSSTLPVTANDAASADRFLKLLVAQMQNQDPMNPMDNAEITSQMAQIATVDGIAQLNDSVQDLSSQFVQMQALQGASLVGHDVIVPGSLLTVTDGLGQGGFELPGAADSVKVEILSAASVVIDTIDMGAQASGLHSFSWPTETANDTSELRFRVTALSGATKLNTTTLMRDRVEAVLTGGDSLMLELSRAGSVPYTSVQAIN